MTQKLQLSPETVAVLRNFSGINKSIIVRPGNTLTTMSETKSIIGQATIAEWFEQEFAIYDLPKFLSSLSLFKEPTLEFEEKRVVMREGSNKLNYTFDDKRTILSIDGESIKKLSSVIDKGEVEFAWADATFQEVSRALAVLKLPEFVVEGDGSRILLRASDTANSTGNSYEATIGESGATFRAVFRAENLRFLPNDYGVRYTAKGFARFQGDGITYYVTTEAKK